MAGLQQRLREVVRRRIAEGGVTGVALAARAGFRQGHLSNFLNGRRKLSVEASDALLAAMQLGVLDLLDEHLAPHAPAEEDEFEAVAMVEARHVLRPNPTPREAREYLKFRRSFLENIRPQRVLARRNWARFIVIQADEAMAAAMKPLIPEGAALLVDRQYNSLKPYHEHGANIYLVWRRERCVLAHVAQQGTQFWLRPANPELPLDFINIVAPSWLEDYVVGRVAWVGMEV